jgi:hypothetical protein
MNDLNTVTAFVYLFYKDPRVRVLAGKVYNNTCTVSYSVIVSHYIIIHG